MNKVNYQLNSKIYLALIALLLSIFGLYWLLTHSFVTLTVVPKNSTVFIDNVTQNVNPSGRVRQTLTPGNHNIEVESEGYISFVGSFDFNRSQNKTIKVSLDKIPASSKIAETGKFLSKGTDFNSIFYLNENDKVIYKDTLTLEGDIVKVKEHLPLTAAKLSGINEIVWAPNKDLALFRKNDGVYLFDFKKYDFVNQTETLWSKDVGSIAWSPDNSKIAYYYTGNGEKTLIFSNIANTDVTRVANLAEMGIENPVLRWSPDSEWLIVIPRNKNVDDNKIYLFSTYSRTFKEVSETGSQLDAIFSPDNNKILYGSYSNDPNNPVRSLLSLMNTDGSNKYSLNLRAEISKIVWKKDSTNLIVASFNDKTGKESLFGFNTKTKEKTGFSINDVFGYITSVLISDDEKVVVYQNQNGVFALKIN